MGLLVRQILCMAKCLVPFIVNVLCFTLQMQFREILCVQISALILKIPEYLVTETRKQNQKFISSLSFRFGF